jgi:hypothetical protein
MGRVYAASAFTIIAATGDGPDAGLAGMSHPRKRQPSIRVGKCLFVGIGKPELDVGRSV